MKKRPNVDMIMAIDSDGGIGKDGGLPWKLPGDLKMFKSLTIGRVVVMGRKTFESLPKPLGGRTNVVLTRDPEYKPAGAFVYNDLDSFMKSPHAQNKIMVIGGSEIYDLFMPLANILHVTFIYNQFDTDTKVKINWNVWKLAKVVTNAIDTNNIYKYDFRTYIRKTS